MKTTFPTGHEFFLKMIEADNKKKLNLAEKATLSYPMQACYGQEYKKRDCVESIKPLPMNRRYELCHNPQKTLPIEAIQNAACFLLYPDPDHSLEMIKEKINVCYPDYKFDYSIEEKESNLKTTALLCEDTIASLSLLNKNRLCEDPLSVVKFGHAKEKNYLYYHEEVKEELSPEIDLQKKVYYFIEKVNLGRLLIQTAACKKIGKPPHIQDPDGPIPEIIKLRCFWDIGYVKEELKINSKELIAKNCIDYLKSLPHEIFAQICANFESIFIAIWDWDAILLIKQQCNLLEEQTENGAKNDIQISIRYGKENRADQGPDVLTANTAELKGVQAREKGILHLETASLNTDKQPVKTEQTTTRQENYRQTEDLKSVLAEIKTANTENGLDILAAEELPQYGHLQRNHFFHDTKNNFNTKFLPKSGSDKQIASNAESGFLRNTAIVAGSIAGTLALTTVVGVLFFRKKGQNSSHYRAVNDNTYASERMMTYGKSLAASSV